MTIETIEVGNVAVLSLSGDPWIDPRNSDVWRAFAELLGRGYRRLVFDFSGARYVDGCTLGDMAACRKRAAESGAEIRLVLQPGTKPHQVFAITRLDEVFEVFGSRKVAVRSFADSEIGVA